MNQHPRFNRMTLLPTRLGHHPNVVFLSLGFLLLLLAFMGVAGAWLWTEDLEESITAQGELIPQGNLRRIMAPAAGIVSNLQVRENQPVKAGQVLVQLDPRSTEVNTDNLLEQRSQLMDEANALRAVLDGKEPDLSSSTFGAVQQAWMSAARETLKTEQAGAERTIDRLQHELEEAKARYSQTQSLLAIAQKRQHDFNNLFKKGGISRNEVRQVEQQVVDLEGQVKSLAETIRSREEALAEASLKPHEQETRYEQSVLDRLAQVEQKIALLDYDLDRSALNEEYTQLTAPEDGIIQELGLFGKGEVVKPGDVLLTMVPDNSPLVAKVKVPNTDLSFLHIGQDAWLTADAFPAFEYGRIPGKVIAISPTTLKDPNGHPYYRIDIALGKTQLAHIKKPKAFKPLRPGMTLSAQLVTRHKNMLSFITEPITKQFDQALRDPSTRD